MTCSSNPLNAAAGVATFAGCAIDKSGNGYTLSATSSGLTGATSNSFNVTVGSAAKLAFTQQPSNSTGGTAFATQPKVAIQDAGGNTVTTDTSSVSLALTLGTGTGGATLSCTTNPGNAVAGVATFAGCAIDKAGTGYTLTATDGSHTLAVSTGFNVVTGIAAKLIFTTSPTDSVVNTAFSVQPVVAVVDAGGNTVTTAANSVNLAITSGTGTSGAALNCTTNPKGASNGVATFAGCKINLVGTGYTLTATSSGLTSAASTSFSVFTPLAPTALTITNGTGGTAGKAEAGDVITITWNQAIQLTSVCSAWTSSTQTVTGVTVSMAPGNGSHNNDLTVTGGTNCTGGINIGTFKASTGGYEPSNGTDQFLNSTVSWNSASSQLVITLGTGSAPGTVSSSTYVYTPDAAIARSGSPGITATGTATTGGVKNF